MYAKGRKQRDFDVDELFIQQLLELPYEVGVSVVDKLKKKLSYFVI
tara:strand:+ start:1998 stop:2135 length:138 start_codon:yes stop_codon:yes gene_type:complete